MVGAGMGEGAEFLSACQLRSWIPAILPPALAALLWTLTDLGLGRLGADHDDLAGPPRGDFFAEEAAQRDPVVPVQPSVYRLP